MNELPLNHKQAHLLAQTGVMSEVPLYMYMFHPSGGDRLTCRRGLTPPRGDVRRSYDVLEGFGTTTKLFERRKHSIEPSDSGRSLGERGSERERERVLYCVFIAANFVISSDIRSNLTAF